MLRANVLGQPTQDNALFVTADSGNGQTRLLLDCGGHTLGALPLCEVQATDHLLFSHLHMDHVAGFDDFFRVNFDRQTRENHLWGPPGAAQILAHRLRGYWWNHAPQMQATWRIHEVDDAAVHTWRLELHEAFEVAHDEGRAPRSGPLIRTPQVSVDAVPLQHQGPCLGYVLREPGRVNVDAAALSRLGLTPGAWLAALKAGAEHVDIAGERRPAAPLRAELLREEAGDSLAYLTDFLLNEGELARLARLLAGVQTLYLEAQYAPADAALAARHHHTTTEQGATLAARAGAQDLVLLHLSRRYREADWREMLRAAQTIFPAARFPGGWLTADAGASVPAASL